MIELKRDESTSFKFSMEIAGDLQGEPTVTFAIRGPQFCLSVKAEKQEGVYCVNLPALSRYLDAGTYETEISVYLEDRFFIPYRDSVCLKDQPKPVISNFDIKTSSSTPTISIKPVQQVKIEPVVDVKEEKIADKKQVSSAEDIDLFGKLLKK